MWATNIFLFAGGQFLEISFYLSPICTISCSDNVLNKINIISAAACLWGINVSDEYFLVRGRVIFGDGLLFILNLPQFSFVRKKTERQTDKQFKLDCKKKKKKIKKRKKKKRKRKWKRKRKNNKKEKYKVKETQFLSIYLMSNKKCVFS